MDKSASELVDQAENSSKTRGNAYDDQHYEQLIATRRCSYQRQLDEQVNQVYELAVRQKLRAGLVREQLPAGRSDLDSIVQPASRLLQAQAGSRPSLSQEVNQERSIYVPLADQLELNNEQELEQRDNRWAGESQLSLDSSSSVRSLRSCWFSMPELYAMNRDSSSQSPSGTGLVQTGRLLEPRTSAELPDQLINALSNKLLLPTHQQQQIQPSGSPCLGQGEGASEWPSSELCKQVTSGHQNWSLHDLNLTNENIAPPGSNLRTGPDVKGPNEQLNRMALELFKGSTLDDSVCVSMPSNSSSSRELEAQVKPGDSRPTSQNSTISSTSCALSDYNCSDLQDLHQLEGQQQAPMAPACTPSLPPATDSSDGSNSAACPPVPERIRQTSLSPLPQCLVTNDRGQMGAPLVAVKQRAMSLVPSARLTPESASPINGGLASPRLLDATFQAPRRRSAVGNLLRSDVAPAVATLDLRLAARRNRVKLADLHPITFINDRKVLDSMSSIKNAGDTKLNAIFNGPVGRRLSVNAEMARNSANNQSKSGIKIGLTGYVYVDRFDGSTNSRRSAHSSVGDNMRRPSLAPNFWRDVENSSADKLGATQVGSKLDASPKVDLGPVRPRSASLAPNSLLTADAEPVQSNWARTEERGRLTPGSVLERPKSPMCRRFDFHTKPEVDINRSFTTLSKIGENEELKQLAGAHSEDATGLNGSDCSSFYASLKLNELMEGQHPVGRDDMESSCPVTTTSSSSNDGSSSSGGESSDDGDLDKLIAQYPDPASYQSLTHTSAKQSEHLSPLVAARHRQEADNFRTRSFCQQASDRVVKNDMILRQLLMANNVATLRVASDSKRSPVNRGRRFSAINLYQCDTDVFVANSMKRPPTNQLQILNTLPLLAGTLPVIPATGQQASLPVKSAEQADKPAQLPIVSNSACRPGVKSIISGSSGLGPVVKTAPTRASSISSDLVAGVDVEEQLNRLRQQEKRSLALMQSFGCSFEPTQSASSGVELSKHSLVPREEDELSSTCSDVLGEVEVPSQPTIPSILRQPGTSLATVVEPDGGALEPNEFRFGGSAKSPANAPKSPPHSPISLLLSSCSSVNSGGGTSGAGNGGSIALPGSPPSLAAISTRPDALAYSGSKSCEPFKQLDTIIEGRGLLLGAEQQSDPSYANRLRRLSGNHSRRSSLGNSSQRGESTEESGNEWCQCDLSPNRPARARNSDSNKATSGDLSRSDSRASIGSSMLDTMKSIARRTLNNLTTSMAVPSEQGEAASAATPKVQLLVKPPDRQRSRSMVVAGSAQTVNEPTIPSRLLREKVRQAEQRRKELPDQMSSCSESSSSSLSTGSPDSSSMTSLDDAENYRTKNKDNKMKHGRSLERSSSESSLSSGNSSIVADGKTRHEHPELGQIEDEGEVEYDGENLEDEEEVGQEEEEEEEDEEEEEEKPKICYKCNRKLPSHYYGHHPDDLEAERDDKRSVATAATSELAAYAQPSDSAEKDASESAGSARPQRLSAIGRSHRPGRRRSSSARRSASISATGISESGSQVHAGHFNRRKNKWHIQRNLAPKLKRQRSFSANYAPVSKRAIPDLSTPVAPLPGAWHCIGAC